jgi:hypothetical protein
MSRWSIIAIFLLFFVMPATAQTSRTITTSEGTAFELYRCEVVPNSRSVNLFAYLANAEGDSLVADIASVEFEAAGFDRATPPIFDNITTTQRNPVRIIVVFDTTSTMPLPQVISSFSLQLVPQLDFADEVALITFASNVSPLTEFYTDKNRLINENMLSLSTVGGQNRVFDALLAAVNSYEPTNGTRNTVLMITDSNRRDVPQADANEIITRANERDVQIYSVGLVTDDRPDIADLVSIAERTNGYTWIYENTQNLNSETALEQSLTTIFNDFVNTLDQEVRLSVDLSNLDLEDAETLNLKATISFTGGAVVSDNIECPVPTGEIIVASTAIVDAISFTNTETTFTTTDPVELEVNVQTALPGEEKRIVFLQNGEIIQSANDTTYNFNTTTLPPGIYTITAQLRNLDNTVFATTLQTITINAQQQLTLNVIEGALNSFDTPIRLEARSNSTVALPNVRFLITQGENTAPLGIVPMSGGSGTLSLTNWREAIRGALPNVVEGQALSISAEIPSAVPNDPLLTQSEPLTVTYTVPAAPPIDTNLMLVIGVSLALLILNILLFLRVKRARVRRMIHRTDGYELPNRLMAVTVYRDNMKHTHTLTKKTITIGRGNSNDINLGDDNKVSRQHGVLMWRKQDWYYTNHKSDTFVKVGGRRYRGHRLILLEPVTELEVGDARVFFHSSSQQDISELTKTNL